MNAELDGVHKYIISELSLDEYKEVLHKLHSKILIIALEIQRICELYHIKYFLIGGSLLGAVRHEGFIPWDDDMDIGMLRDDYNAFLRVCKSQLGQDFYILNNEVADYGLPFSKIALKNTLFLEKDSPHYSCGNGVFVDIFPIDKIPDTNIERKFHARFSLVLRNALLIKTQHIEKSKFKNSIIWTVSNWYACTHSKDRIVKRLNQNAQRFNSRNVKLYYNSGSAYRYGKEVFPVELLDHELSRISFEGIEFPCPNNPTRVLELLYGDYMQLPPEDKRYNRHSVVEIQI